MKDFLSLSKQIKRKMAASLVKVLNCIKLREFVVMQALHSQFEFI